MVVETLGGWDEEAVRTIIAIGRSQGHPLRIPLSDSTRHLFQRLLPVYGGETPAYASAAFCCIHLQLTNRADFYVFVVVFSCFCFLCIFVCLF